MNWEKNKAGSRTRGKGVLFYREIRTTSPMKWYFNKVLKTTKEWALEHLGKDLSRSRKHQAPVREIWTFLGQENKSKGNGTEQSTGKVGGNQSKEFVAVSGADGKVLWVLVVGMPMGQNLHSLSRIWGPWPCIPCHPASLSLAFSIPRSSLFPGQVKPLLQINAFHDATALEMSGTPSITSCTISTYPNSP